MNEPKRRGRPPKAKPELVELPVVDAPPIVIERVEPVSFTPKDVGAILLSRHLAAQAYATRVYEGQSVDVPHAERIARIARALAGQGLSMEGVTLP